MASKEYKNGKIYKYIDPLKGLRNREQYIKVLKALKKKKADSKRKAITTSVLSTEVGKNTYYYLKNLERRGLVGSFLPPSGGVLFTSRKTGKVYTGESLERKYREELEEFVKDLRKDDTLVEHSAKFFGINNIDTIIEKVEGNLVDYLELIEFLIKNGIDMTTKTYGDLRIVHVARRWYLKGDAYTILLAL